MSVLLLFVLWQRLRFENVHDRNVEKKRRNTKAKVLKSLWKSIWKAWKESKETTWSRIIDKARINHSVRNVSFIFSIEHFSNRRAPVENAEKLPRDKLVVSTQRLNVLIRSDLDKSQESIEPMFLIDN